MRFFDVCLKFRALIQDFWRELLALGVEGAPKNQPSWHPQEVKLASFCFFLGGGEGEGELRQEFFLGPSERAHPAPQIWG